MTRRRLLLVVGLLGLAVAGARWLWPEPAPSTTRTSMSKQDIEALIAGDYCVFAPATPYDPASGLDRLAPRAAPADARCPVCGMYPARYPRWAAQVIYRDGAAHFFDSPIDLFVFLQRVGHYAKSYDADDVAAMYVSAYASGAPIPARDAYFVHGSDVLGPMRDADLPAFADLDSARAFATHHGGNALAFSEVTTEVVTSLSRNRQHRH